MQPFCVLRPSQQRPAPGGTGLLLLLIIPFSLSEDFRCVQGVMSMPLWYAE